MIDGVFGAGACKTQKESGVICDQKIATGSLDQGTCVLPLEIISALLPFPIPKRYPRGECEDEIPAFVARLDEDVIVVGDLRLNMRSDVPPRTTTGLGSGNQCHRLAHFLREVGRAAFRRGDLRSDYLGFWNCCRFHFRRYWCRLCLGRCRCRFYFRSCRRRFHFLRCCCRCDQQGTAEECQPESE